MSTNAVDAVREKLAQIRAQQKANRPSLIPVAAKPRAPEREVEVLPNADVILDAETARTLTELVETHAQLATRLRDLDAEKTACAERIKALCQDSHLDRVQAGSYRVRLYDSPRSTIKRDLLLANGVTPAVIAACTVTTVSTNLRITAAKKEEL